ncbi:MAG: hypothetical protein AAF292_00255 [Pseudomonadota bacterium]
MDVGEIHLAILLVALTLNAIGDVFLLRGAREVNYEPGLDALERTSESDIRFGALLGLLVIPPWFLILPYLSDIPGAAGLTATLAWATYVAAVFAFHLGYAFVGPAIKRDPSLKAQLGKLIGLIALYSMLTAIIASIALAYAGFSGSLDMSWYHYATLPAVTVIFFQAVLGGIFKRVPHFQIICGPLAMAAFFIGFFDMVNNNAGVFAGG